MSKRTQPTASIAALEDELDYLYLRHVLVTNLIKALEVYAMASPKDSPDGENGKASA